jgi:hypothetical protein
LIQYQNKIIATSPQIGSLWVRTETRRHHTVSTTAPTQANEEAERNARHMQLSREMGELAMGLARAVAARAQSELSRGVHPPQSAEAAKPFFRNTPEAILHFTRLCKIIEIAIALEARIAKGLSPSIPKPRPAAAAAPIAQANQLSRTAAALAASTSLTTPVTPTWQPKSAVPNPVVAVPALSAQLLGLPIPSLKGTSPT